MSGKLIVIEGTDGSGKSTQFDLLCRLLCEKGVPFERLIFPQYNERSSALIHMYLEGEFGDSPDDVNPYAASTFFAVDRYASYKKHWGKIYRDGGLIITDRYTTSNAIHQAGKLPEDERETYLGWLFDFEYRLLGLPAPDLTLFLDMPSEVSIELLQKRDEKKADIHEKDREYLIKCRTVALESARRCSWKKIACLKDGKLRDICDIHADIAEAVLSFIK